ncbi:c-type cytochrome [Bradyrhizobium sp. CSA207]|uniref:c-type cytochrome n=1 Tax=Bradyrhizobium sp. CSA207 TaxID=2698826 RepID=UPI0023B0D52D|nr:c-type cytochrome [Bradyrhizobium sp. CSA207]MDE5447023.1 c-type cytochrome [Bradyrhizobium sp. CSA207]
MKFSAIPFVLMVFALPARAADNKDRGKQLFEQCTACHSLNAHNNDNGPSLEHLIGRHTASVPDYTYSPALKRANFEWTVNKLDAFLTSPQNVVRGTKMPFAGMADARDRADLIAYLEDITR